MSSRPASANSTQATYLSAKSKGMHQRYFKNYCGSKATSSENEADGQRNSLPEPTASPASQLACHHEAAINNSYDDKGDEKNTSKDRSFSSKDFPSNDQHKNASVAAAPDTGFSCYPSSKNRNFRASVNDASTEGRSTVSDEDEDCKSGSVLFREQRTLVQGHSSDEETADVGAATHIRSADIMGEEHVTKKRKVSSQPSQTTGKSNQIWLIDDEIKNNDENFDNTHEITKLVAKVLQLPEIDRYKTYKDPRLFRGHLLQAFLPHGKRYGGYLVCHKCQYAICFVRLLHSLSETKTTILYTPDCQSQHIDDIIQSYFDMECSQTSSPNRPISELDSFKKARSLHTGLRAKKLSKNLSQHIVRNKERLGEAFYNQGQPLTQAVKIKSAKNSDTSSSRNSETTDMNLQTSALCFE